MIETTTDKPLDLLPVDVHPNNLPHKDRRVPESTTVYGLQRLVKWIIPVAVPTVAKQCCALDGPRHNCHVFAYAYFGLLRITELAWFFFNDLVKRIAYRILDPTEAALLAVKGLNVQAQSAK